MDQVKKVNSTIVHYWYNNCSISFMKAVGLIITLFFLVQFSSAQLNCVVTIAENGDKSTMYHHKNGQVSTDETWD